MDDQPGQHRHRDASPHTVASYRDAIRLLLRFAQRRTGKAPHQLDIDDLDAPLIGAFLNHLEADRAVSVRTRNARLTAIRPLFGFAAYRHPEHAAVIQRVLAIPPKRTDRALVTYLNEEEMHALLAAPDRATRIGRRDHALLLLALETGLRVSELTALTCGTVHLDTGAHVRCHGKGRKERITPLRRQTRALLHTWLTERAGAPTAPLFPGPTGQPLSRDAVRRLVERHVATAAVTCPSLSGKTVSPHTLRHSCAMTLRRHGVDAATIALWLGHFSGDPILSLCVRLSAVRSVGCRCFCLSCGVRRCEWRTRGGGSDAGIAGRVDREAGLLDGGRRTVAAGPVGGFVPASSAVGRRPGGGHYPHLCR